MAEIDRDCACFNALNPVGTLVAYFASFNRRRTHIPPTGIAPTTAPAAVHDGSPAVKVEGVRHPVPFCLLQVVEENNRL